LMALVSISSFSERSFTVKNSTPFIIIVYFRKMLPKATKNY
jgi:hypothetical protein